MAEKSFESFTGILSAIAMAAAHRSSVLGLVAYFCANCAQLMSPHVKTDEYCSQLASVDMQT